jgi:hypothetical protein
LFNPCQNPGSWLDTPFYKEISFEVEYSLQVMLLMTERLGLGHSVWEALALSTATLAAGDIHAGWLRMCSGSLHVFHIRQLWVNLLFWWKAGREEGNKGGGEEGRRGGRGRG